MVGGVAFHADGVATGYSISDRHPGDHLLTGRAVMAWQAVPARDRRGRPLVLHTCLTGCVPTRRAAVPYLAPVIEMCEDVQRLHHSKPRQR